MEKRHKNTGRISKAERHIINKFGFNPLGKRPSEMNKFAIKY